MVGAQSPRRVRQSHVDWVTQRLSTRDWQVIEAVARVRLATGLHLERLCFHDLAGRSRQVVRWRVLKRLTDWRVLTALPRRIGGAARGSAATIYTLDTTGHLLLSQRNASAGRRPRRPGAPGERFTRHTLAITDLWVHLVDADRAGWLRLEEFRAEPDAWMPDGAGGWLKPDAFTTVSRGQVCDDWFLEVDLATEHLPALRRKLDAYLDFWQRGQLGPHEVMPRVLITTPDKARHHAVAGLLDQLPDHAGDLVHVTTAVQAAGYLSEVLGQ